MKITNPIAIFVGMTQISAGIYEVFQGRFILTCVWVFVGLANICMGLIP